MSSGFPVVDLDDLLAVVALEPQNLIQLRMQSLKLAVLGAHNKEGHAEHDRSVVLCQLRLSRSKMSQHTP